MSEHWRDQLEKAGYKFEFDYGYWDYDWSRVLVYSRDRRVFVLSDSGCSCNYLGDNWAADNVEGELRELSSVPPLDEINGYLASGHGDDAFTVQDQFRALGLR